VCELQDTEIETVMKDVDVHLNHSIEEIWYWRSSLQKLSQLQALLRQSVSDSGHQRDELKADVMTV
jgi:hypothetical protein